jgi:flagellar P-ring protein precursor FlgI
VVGLNGTGDSKLDATSRSLAQMFRQMGVEVPDRVDSKNVAGVIVTANLPPFSRTGSRIDIVVNSVGDAKSLMGGTLLVTPLKAPDQVVYAVAQGVLMIGGDKGNSGHPTVARVPGGAIIERELKVEFDRMRSLRLAIRDADFTTAARVAKTINMELSGKYATPRDARTIDIVVPFQYENQVVELVGIIENLEVTPDLAAKVVVNERTGTVVMGENVSISACSVSHGNLTITIQDESEPANMKADQSRGPAGGVSLQAAPPKKKKEEKVAVMELPKATRIKDVVRALNTLGVKPRDLVDILQAMKAAGALHAELALM